MRGLGWIVAGVGILLVLVATGMIGDSNRKNETVPADEWADSVCAAVGVWRGQAEAISLSFRLSTESSELTETAASNPEGKLGAAQIALERALEAADTLVEGIERAGVPDTAQGEQAAEQVQAWADGARDDLNEVEDLLDEEPDTLEDDVARVAEAGAQIAGVLDSGRRILVTVAAADPQLEAALRSSGTCQLLQEESGR
jgi:hypothetical protein